MDQPLYLLLHVRGSENGAAGQPSLAAVQVTEKVLERWLSDMETLSQAQARDPDVLEIRWLDYSVTWLDRSKLPDELAHAEEEHPFIRLGREYVTLAEYWGELPDMADESVDVPTRAVRRDSLSFTAEVRYGGAALATRDVPNSIVFELYHSLASRCRGEDLTRMFQRLVSLNPWQSLELLEELQAEGVAVGPAAVQALLSNPDPDVRLEAMRVLARGGPVDLSASSS